MTAATAFQGLPGDDARTVRAGDVCALLERRGERWLVSFPLHLERAALAEALQRAHACDLAHLSPCVLVRGHALHACLVMRDAREPEWAPAVRSVLAAMEGLRG